MHKNVEQFQVSVTFVRLEVTLIMYVHSCYYFMLMTF